jgi:UDP-N-acetylmuramyl pentapeptide phosphotransferase/UDP-N-acetylglucosamine-1-phosphate transferase
MISFFVAMIATLFIIKFSHSNNSILDHDLKGVQKMHSHPVPRIGGLAIYISALVGAGFAYYRVAEIGIWICLLLLSATFAFGCGIVEDITKNVSPLRRLVLTMTSALVGFFLIGAAIIRVDLQIFDIILKHFWISIPLTVFAVAGVANAINIIDGYNGLASVVTICMFFSLAYVAFQVGDIHVMTAAFIMIGSIAGFLMWNYPHGLIFLGDGGAYFLGFMLGELVILLIARNPQVSAWYGALLLIYPVFETLFSIYRKKFIRGISPGLPDGIHLHMLIFKRLVRWTVGRRDARALTRRNSMTSPYLWLLSLMAVVPATIFWNNNLVLVIFIFLFVSSYVWFYFQIIRFNVPRWLIVNRKK